MAGVAFSAVTAEIATGTSAKTLAQIVAAAQQRVLIKEIAVSFKGTSNTNAPIIVELLRQTDAGTMSALTLVKRNADDGETLQTTANHTATAEPAGTTAIWAWEIHPQQGVHWQAPFGGEFIINGGDRLGVRVTAANDVSAKVSIHGEE